MVILPAGARGQYKIQCTARWHERCYFSSNLTDFKKLFFKIDKKNESELIFCGMNSCFSSLNT